MNLGNLWIYGNRRSFPRPREPAPPLVLPRITRAEWCDYHLYPTLRNLHKRLITMGITVVAAGTRRHCEWSRRRRPGLAYRRSSPQAMHLLTTGRYSPPFFPHPDGTPAVSSGLTMTWDKSTSWLSSLSASLMRFSSWAIFCSSRRTRASSSSGRRGRGTSG